MCKRGILWKKSLIFVQIVKVDKPMSKDLTHSSVERQNILNNRFALEAIAKSLDVEGGGISFYQTNGGRFL